MNFIFQGRKTNLFYLLQAGLTTDGAKVTRRQKGYSDSGDIKNLVKAGYLEPRATGPRGGTHYFTTDAGLNVAAAALDRNEGRY